MIESQPLHAANATTNRLCVSAHIAMRLHTTNCIETTEIRGDIAVGLHLPNRLSFTDRHVEAHLKYCTL